MGHVRFDPTVATAQGGPCPRQPKMPVDGLTFGLARDTEVFDGAFRLVHDQYVWRRYMAPHPSGRRLGVHHLIPSTKVFVSKAESRVVGTMTLVADSPLGLPMDEIYGEELGAFRDRGNRVCEASALAIDVAYRSSGVEILARLIAMMLVYAAHVQRLDHLCIAVNPRHVGFYLKAFASSRVFGGVKTYPKVGAPAVGLHLSLDFVRRQIRALQGGDPRTGDLYGFLFAPAQVERILTGLRRDLPYSSMSIEQFVHFTSIHDVLDGVSAWERAFVTSFYPPWSVEEPARERETAEEDIFVIPR